MFPREVCLTVDTQLVCQLNVSPFRIKRNEQCVVICQKGLKLPRSHGESLFSLMDMRIRWFRALALTSNAFSLWHPPPVLSEERGVW